jgi:putative endonuclease
MRTSAAAMKCVYIMSSNSGVLYLGVTSDLERRVAEHKAATSGFAARYRCRRLVFYECCDSIKAAIAREKQLKGWRRSKKAALISSLNPRWEDLSEEWMSASPIDPG